MTGAEFLSLVRLYSRSNTTTFPLADVVTFANAAKDVMCQEIEKVNEGFFSMEQKANLVANQRLYTNPLRMMNRIEKLYVKFPTWDKWREANEVLLSMQPWPMDEDSIQSRYSDDRPSFMIRRNSIILLTHSAIPTAANGLTLWAKVYPSPFTTTTLASNADLSVAPTSTGVGIPYQIHELLARKVSVLYKQNRDRPIPLTESEQLIEADLQKAIKAIQGQNIARTVVAQMDDFDPELGTGLRPRFLPFS